MFYYKSFWLSGELIYGVISVILLSGDYRIKNHLAESIIINIENINIFTDLYYCFIYIY
ncbi:hypothetical protein SALWKB2_1396 [Snodgrassella alvi wkB2]|nr:hypothetical protein SALWKB2_1396 [Snodgrassella alvi wkB2]